MLFVAYELHQKQQRDRDRNERRRKLCRHTETDRQRDHQDIFRRRLLIPAKRSINREQSKEQSENVIVNASSEHKEDRVESNY